MERREGEKWKSVHGAHQRTSSHSPRGHKKKKKVSQGRKEFRLTRIRIRRSATEIKVKATVVFFSYDIIKEIWKDVAVSPRRIVASAAQRDPIWITRIPDEPVDRYGQPGAGQLPFLLIKTSSSSGQRIGCDFMESVRCPQMREANQRPASSVNRRHLHKDKKDQQRWVNWIFYQPSTVNWMCRQLEN